MKKKIQSESNIKRREIYPFSCKASVINYLFFNCVVPGLMAQAFIWITSICFEGFKFPSFKAYIVTLLVIFSLAIVFLLVVLILNNVLDGYHYTITNDRLFIPKYEFRKKSFSLLFYLSHFDNLENKYFHSIPVKKIRQVKVGQGPIQKKINLYSLFIVLQYGSKIKLQMSMPFDMCEKIKSAIDNSEK